MKHVGSTPTTLFVGDLVTEPVGQEGDQQAVFEMAMRFEEKSYDDMGKTKKLAKGEALAARVVELGDSMDQGSVSENGTILEEMAQSNLNESTVDLIQEKAQKIISNDNSHKLKERNVEKKSKILPNRKRFGKICQFIKRVFGRRPKYPDASTRTTT
ncbi:hypothetical protein L6452_37486 [Arctium lappa]|uniref:Uncharacterized protein n=1 Tax=Arctium lappa TaxID=4217 RepID=A0ACB8Y345_ARCLA|nr:hypothetical protein L6452_37486 [Arctium lappa]